MTKITVVISKSTGRLIPFGYADNGEIIIASTEHFDEDDLIVTTVDAFCIDWEDNKLLSASVKKHVEAHPFYADFYTN